jgi:hypothetical protein
MSNELELRPLPGDIVFYCSYTTQAVRGESSWFLEERGRIRAEAAEPPHDHVGYNPVRLLPGEFSVFVEKRYDRIAVRRLPQKDREETVVTGRWWKFNVKREQVFRRAWQEISGYDLYHGFSDRPETSHCPASDKGGF